MTDPLTLESLLNNLNDSGSRTSFLHLTEDKGETSPVPEQSYKLQLEHLEDRLRELASLIRARDRELDGLYQEQSLSPIPQVDQDYATRLVTLEEENQQLKALSGLKVESERLKGELKLVNQAIEGYEEKLVEVNARLRDMEEEDVSKLFGGNEEMTDLMKKISLFQHANGDLQGQVEQAKASLKDLQTENDRLKSSLIPDLQRQISACEQRRAALKDSITGLKLSLAVSAKCNLAAGIWNSPKVLKKAGKHKGGSPRPSPRVTPAPGAKDVGERAKSPKGGKKEYVPSFMRSKKPVAVLAKKKGLK